jgi:TonB family protein
MRSEHRRFGAGVAVALAVHALALGALSVVARRIPPPRPEEPEAEPMEVLAIEDPVLRALPPLGPLAPTPSLPDDPPPPDTTFIAERDSNPVHETRLHRPVNMAPRPPAEPSDQPEPPDPAVTQPPAPTAPPVPAPATAAPAQAPTPPVPEPPAADDDEPEPAPTAAAPTAAAAPATEAPPDEVPPPAPAPPPPAPAPAGPEPLVTFGIGGSGEDILRNLPMGSDATVRAKRSALAVFQNQLRGTIRSQWRPKPVYQEADPTGRVGRDQLQTVLKVRVQGDGRLAHVEVSTPSGVPELDEEAMGSFRRVRPLPRPPTVLLDQHGGYVFQFSFMLDVTEARYALALRRALRELWRQPMAFRRAGDHERVTLARVVLALDGVVKAATIASSAGSEFAFLDGSVLAAVKQGTRLPRPPPDFGVEGGVCSIWVEFRHRVGAESEIKVLRPGEAPGRK